MVQVLQRYYFKKNSYLPNVSQTSKKLFTKNITIFLCTSVSTKIIASIFNSFLGMLDYFISSAQWDYKLQRYFSTTQNKLNRLHTHSLTFSTGQDTWDYFHGFMNYVIIKVIKTIVFYFTEFSKNPSISSVLL